MILEEIKSEEFRKERKFSRKYTRRIPGKGVTFLDRPLQPGEQSNYICNKCGVYLSHDTLYSHIQRCQGGKS